MKTVLPLDRMTTAEKLQEMEALWTDLSRNDAYESPDWHATELRERQLRVEEGKETFVDWEAAKNQLRDRLR